MRKPVYSQVFAGCADAEERAALADAEWKALCEDVEVRGQMTDQRKRIIDRLVRERVEYEFLYPEVAATGAVTVGPNGGDVFNFQWSALQKIKDQIAKLETALRIPVDQSSEGKKPEKAVTPADSYLSRARAN